MILQSSDQLDKAINKSGCYFMSLLFQASQKIKKSFTIEDIQNIKQQSITCGYLTDECFVNNPEGILLLAGLSTTYTNRHEPPTRKATEDEIEILYFRNGDDGHFVAGKNGFVAFDPLGQSMAVKHGKLESKRIFKIRGI